MLEKSGMSEGMDLDYDLPSVRPTRVITYAWGKTYIDELLAITLPALLAPGNLPAVASAVPCEVVILTEEAFFPDFLNAEIFARIRELCPVRLVSLDDLIPAPDKYGMALSYVLHRGFADLGPAMTDTWLMFLNADFILADGSLRNLLRRLAEGHRLVASPSYCAVSEGVRPQLLARVDANTGVLSFPPRELAALLLRHTHNTIRGKTINQSTFFMRYMDQFYWQVDSDTLIGHQMPIAIVGMQPERHLAEPNSYWDHGLMREFFPTTEHFVIGDSDEFLMLELRGERVAHDQMLTLRPDAGEIARNLRHFLTAYQRDMVHHPLTLHAADLPAATDAARLELRAFVDRVLSALPPVLPSHIDHPQWDYHRPGFMEARHKHLSRRLGPVTESEAPPTSLPEVDRVWWELDGLDKAHARRRAEVRDLAEHQRGIVAILQARLEQERLSDADRQLQHDLEAVHEGTTAAGLNRVVRVGADEAASQSPHNDGMAEPWMRAILTHAGEWARAAEDLRGKRRLLGKTLDFIEQIRDERLQHLDVTHEAATKELRAHYAGLTKRRVRSAAIPHVEVRHGPTPPLAPMRNFALQTARDLYHRGYGRPPRLRPLHPYWAPLRHVVRVVDAAAASGASNVLTVIAGHELGDRVADHLPGLHARVSLAELMQGNLIKAFGEPPEFDLCICTLGPGELGQLPDILEAISPCMRSGGKFVGFYPNFSLAPLPVDEGTLLRSISAFGTSGRILYAGSARSSRVVRRFYRGSSASSRIVSALRMAAMLPLTTASALHANRMEAAATEEQSTRPGPDCTSMTIEVTM